MVNEIGGYRPHRDHGSDGDGLQLTDEQQLWKDTLQSFMDREVGREYTRKHDESREFPDEAYRKIADRGWLGLLIPEEHGGLDADPVMYAI